jgi:short-subunit dehydrogenase
MEQSQYALITGASSGIGLELSKIAAKFGMNLILVARNERSLTELKIRLEELYSIEVKLFICDLSEVHAADKVITFLQSSGLEPDILINNAGFGLYGPFDETDVMKENQMMQVNIVVLTQLSKYIYKQMKSRNHGCIMNVSSVAGFMPGPLMAVYYASKTYVLSFSQALANEAKGSGVTVTVLCPGPTKSNFETNAFLGSSMLFKSFGNLPDAATVAEFGFKKMLQGKIIAIQGGGNRFMIFLTRFFPHTWVTSIVRFIQRKM